MATQALCRYAAPGMVGDRDSSVTAYVQRKIEIRKRERSRCNANRYQRRRFEHRQFLLHSELKF
jgi:hypothetical protein